MIHNVHQREFHTSETRLGELLDRVGGPTDQLWPRRWPPMTFDRPLGPGADGGHGPIRYRVSEHRPGERVEFTFRPPTPLRGTHALEVLPGSRPDTAVLRHVLTGRTVGLTGWAAWTLMIHWMHNTVVEEMLDNAGVAVGDPPARPTRWSLWIRLGRCILRADDQVPSQA